MRNCARTALAAAAGALLCWAPAMAAPLTPSALKPCAFDLAEIAAAFGVPLERAEAADMTIPVGRDVGCLYSLKGSDFVFGVRQTWDSTRKAGGTPAGLAPGYRSVAGDPDGAVYVTDAGSGGSGEVVYVRGKVQTRVFWHGGNLSTADGLALLLKLRHVP